MQPLDPVPHLEAQTLVVVGLLPQPLLTIRRRHVEGGREEFLEALLAFDVHETPPLEICLAGVR